MINDIKVNHTESSKIIGVNLYGSRAEITRSFKLGVKEGQNNVEIEGLPWVLINDSLRVEGRGPATIHDVNLSPVDGPSKPVISPTLEELSLKKKRAENALERCKKSISALEGFLKTVNAQFTKSDDLRSVLKDYDASACQLDDRVMELEKDMSQIEEQIKEEREKIAPKTPHDLGYRMSVGVVADSETEIELVLIYAVSSASWKAAYDIRVDTSGKSNPVKLIYKAVITNATRETWDNIPLTLETATPTFGVDLPSLDQWYLSVYQPKFLFGKSKKAVGSVSLSRAGAGAPPSGGISYELEKYDPTIEDSYSPMPHLTTQVTSKGAISATFRVPGLVTIPPDNGEHTFTIVELNLDAAMTWYSAPKLEARVHLKAKIKNDSEYALLAGNASVYVDGSFISKSTVPAVSPLESFDCPLGLDQAVRITYHPVSKKATTSGFYNKSASHVYIQRLTIHNTKPSGIPLLKIVDHIPVSEDSSITVKLISPALKLPSSGSGGGITNTLSETHGTLNKTSVKQSQSSSHTKTASLSLAEVVASSAGPNVKVANGIVAQWDSADEESVDSDALGRDGKINWLCQVPAGEKVNLSLQWEVSMPTKTRVVGL